MRVTIRDLDRAFPELDGLADGERARVLRRARADGRVPALVSPSAAMLALAGYLQLVAPGLYKGAESIASDAWFWVLWVGFALGAGACGALVALMIRDGLVHRALRMAPRSPRCGHCRHSLEGLPPIDASDFHVRCPECGVVGEM